MHHHIPDEFPASSDLFSLGALQQKYSLRRDVDGKLRRPGDTMRGRLERYSKCRCIVALGTREDHEVEARAALAW